jgi:hypothetical protein
MLFAATGCFGSSGGNGNQEADGDCTHLAGSYTLSGTCAATVCSLSQSGCSFSMACDDGSSFNGSVDGPNVDFAGGGISCSGTLQDYGDATKNAEVEGSCTVSGSTCGYEAKCQSGQCAADEVPSGSGGSGTAGNTSSGGSSPQGGSTSSAGTTSSGGSSSTLDPTCEAGAVGVCACLEGTDSACTEDDLALLYQACVDGLTEGAFIACFANYVVNGQIDCTAAANACIEGG